MFFEQTFNESTMCQEEWEREAEKLASQNALQFDPGLTRAMREAKEKET